MLHIETTEVHIPDLRKELSLLLITDLHLLLAGGRDTDYARRHAESRVPFFPHSSAILAEIERHIAENPPDITLVTGDFIDFPSAENLDALDAFLNGLCKNYLYVIGNHDWCYPCEVPDDATRGRNHPLFASVCPNPDFQVLDLGEVLLVGVDDSTNQVTRDQIEKTKEVFGRGKPCVVFLHVPVYAPTMLEACMSYWGQPIMIGMPMGKLALPTDAFLVPSPETYEFVDLLKDPSSPVAAVFAGHVHFSHKDEIAPGRFQCTTALASTLENAVGTVAKIRVLQPPNSDVQ